MYKSSGKWYYDGLTKISCDNRKVFLLKYGRLTGQRLKTTSLLLHSDFQVLWDWIFFLIYLKLEGGFRRYICI